MPTSAALGSPAHVNSTELKPILLNQGSTRWSLKTTPALGLRMSSVGRIKIKCDALLCDIHPSGSQHLYTARMQGSGVRDHFGFAIQLLGRITLHIASYFVPRMYSLEAPCVPVTT